MDCSLNLVFNYFAAYFRKHMKHLQTNFSRACGPTQDLGRRNSLRQSLQFLTMLARQVVTQTVTNIICLNFKHILIFYQMQVNYQTDSFVAKNRDYVVNDHRNLMSSSNSSFIAALFPPLPKESSRPSYKFSSVASRFKVHGFSLVSLLLNLLIFV